MKLRALRYTLLLSGLFGISFLLRASLPTVATGTWVAAGNMSAARSGACTVALNDGRLLISGGADANGPTATADLFSTTGSWSAASMNSPRSHQSCAELQDGRVLVAGGTTSGGGITNSAEIYDPRADSWAQAGLMNDARSGATASVLQDGRVLITGGQNSGGASNTLEIFDPNSGNFSNAGTMSSPRQDHAAAALTDGRVLLVGGSSDGTNALNTSDIYDPQAGSVSAGPAMSAPRAKATATTLLDGTVVVIGGSNGTSDLASAEFFDPAANNFTLVASLATARSKHSAFLLPNNNEVLVVGGQSAGNDLASAELYIPWQKAFQATGAMATPRSDATGAALTAVDGRLLIAGGSSASAELYGFGTVKTDAADYPPGSIVTITGTGWQPGETVTLTLVESPLIDTHGPYTVTADAFGNISNSSFVTDTHDENIRFYLTAAGSQSQAQNTFTDSVTLNLTFSGSNPGAVTSSTPSGINCTFNGSGTTGTGSCSLSGITNNATVTLNANRLANWTLPSQFSAVTCSNPTASCTLMVNNNSTGTVTVSFLALSAPAFTSGTSTTFTVGTAGSFPVTATGNPPPTFSESGALPSGVTFNSATGVLSGTPAAGTAGTYSITFTATNSQGTATQNNFTLTVNNPLPTTTSISPTSKIVGATAFTLTVNGTNFISGVSVVQFAGSARTTTFVNSTQLTVSIPATDLTTAGTFNITVFSPTPGGGTSNAQTFTVNNPLPTTTSISPTSRTVGDAAFTLTVNGTNFISGVSVVQFAGSARTTTFVNSTQLTASIPATDLTTAGTFNITVFNPTPGGGTSNTQTFTVNNPLPTTTSISPTNKIVGATAFTLTVNGTNFVSTSVVQFAGSNRTTTFVNSTQVTATILASDLTTAGTFNITVFSPTPGGGTSNAQIFTVNNPLPTTTSISPTNKIVGATAFTLTVNGTNFVSTSVVQFAGSARTTTFVNSTQLTASILATDLTTAGTFNISVFNPTPGGGTSNAQTFTVVSPPVAPSTPVLLPTTAGNPEDNVTASVTPSFYGTTGSTATTVIIYSDGVAVGSGTAANYANNTIGVSASTPLSVGAHSMTAVATDQFGNTSPASGALSIEVVRDIPAPTVIGTANTNNTAANALTQTTGVAVALGNTVFVTVGMDAGTQTVTISDNATGGSNTYTEDADVTNGSGTTGVRTLVFSAPVIHALTSSNTITISAGGAVNMAATYFYSTGLVSPSPKDKFSTNSGNSTTPASGTTAATSQADELLLGAVTYERQQGQLDVSTGNSFVNLAKSSPGGQAVNQFQLESAYQPVRAAGAYQASWTYNNGQQTSPQLWAAAIVTYKIVFPTISSIVMAPASITTPPSTTNLNNVNFTVTFSEPVLGIDAEDFALDLTNTTVSGASITGVTTTDNTVYTVAVNTGTGNGTIQLNYHDDADVTVDGNNIPLNGSAAVTPLTISGPTYTVSKSVATSLALAAPSPASVSFGSTGAVIFSATLARTSGGAAISGATVNFTVDGNAAGSGTTDGSGVATLSYNPSALSVAGHNVQASFADATISGSTYTASTSGTQTLTVSTASQTITFAQPPDKTYGDAPFTISATGGASGNPVTFSAGPATVCSAGGTNGSTITIVGAGSCTITASQAGNNNYSAAANVSQSFSIAKTTPTVSFSGAPASAYFNSQFTVSASTNASTTPTITATGACTISGTTVTIISGVGTCSLLASWAADTNYVAATSTQSTTALQAPVSVTVPDTTVTYDGTPKSITPTVSPAVAYAVTYTGISPTVYATSSSAPTEPGSYTVVATVTDTTDYTGTGSGTLTTSQKDPALVLTLLTGMPEPSTYGTRVYYELTIANSPCPTGQVQFFVDSDSTPSSTVPLTSTTCTKPVEFSTATLTPGTHTVYAVYGGDTYYVNETSAKVSHEVIADGTAVTLATSATEVFVGDAVTLTATVTPSNSIDGSAAAPSGKVQFYDNTATLLGESALSSNTATFTISSLPAGPHSITATYVSSNGDFGGSSSPVSLETVDKITPTITWDNSADIVYGTKLSATQLNATATDTHNGGIPISGTFTYNPAADTVLAVGSRNLTVTFTPDDTATYGNQTALATINVTPATLTVTADDASQPYGADNPTFTFQYSGFVNSEGSAIVTTAPTCSSTANSKSSVGNYAITCLGGVAPNYTIKYVDGKLTVNPALLTITANDTTKTYGDTVTFTGTEFTTSGLVNSDAVSSVTLTSAGATATAAVAGSPYAITPSAAVGTGLTNYTMTYKDGKLTVNRRNATWTTNSNSKTYGYADPVPLTTGSGDFLAADGVTAAYSRAAGETVLAGPYHITATLGPAAVLTNYTITNAGASFTVNAAPLSVTPADANRLYGSANPGFTATIVGIKNGDPITASYGTTATQSSNVGSYDITATLSDPANKLSNYTVTLNKGTLTINPAPLTIKADGKSKFLNAANPPLTATYSGFVLGQDPSALSGTLSCTTTATTNSSVGSYPINCSGQTSTNYAITYVLGTLSITYVTGGMCAGDVGHQIRQPINADGSSVWKQGATVPAKFAVCDANGVSIGTPGVVTSFNLISIVHGTTTNVDESPASTTPDTAFRWDPTGQQWIFNISTKSAPVNLANQTYIFQILLTDGSTINFQFGLK